MQRQRKAIESQLCDLMEQEDSILTAISESGRPEPTAKELEKLQAIRAQMKPLKQERDRLEAVAREKVSAIGKAEFEKEQNAMNTKVPAKAIASKNTLFASHQDAYDVGQWARAVFTGSEQAFDHCRDRGILNAMSTGSNPAGGFLVPEPLENAIIELREQYGAFRQNASVVQMGDAVMILPKVAGEVTSYWVGEAATITASDATVQQVKLDAKKLGVLTTMSSELSEDSVVSVAELLARSVAYSFAVAEDQAGFNGDGTSPYGGIVGLSGALAAGSKITATSNLTFGALTFANFEAVVGKCKRYGLNQKWYISRAGWANSMQRLMNAAGGVTMAELAAGAQPSFLGFPVVWSEVLESRTTGTTGATACYFGDLQAGAYLGNRRGVSIAIDGSRYFEQDVLALRATQRLDIVVHDRGDASNAGGLCALVFG